WRAGIMANDSMNFGKNADLIKAVADLYIGKGATVLHVICGPGAFEEETDTSDSDLSESDLPTTAKDEQHVCPPRANENHLAPNSLLTNTVSFFLNLEVEIMVIESIIYGTNADLIKAVGDLYIRDGDVVVDPTWGKGTFWK